jgi:BNR repeat-like domain
MRRESRFSVVIIAAGVAVMATSFMPSTAKPISTFAPPFKLARADGGTEPRIAFGPDGRGWTVSNSGGTAVVYSSSDNGRTWKKTLGDPAGQTGPTIDVDIVATKTGRLVASELDSAGLNFPTSFSDDGGKTWTQSRGTQLADMDRQWLAAGPDPQTHQPTVYLLYHNLLSGTVTHNMWVMKSTDNGATFGPPIPITLPGQPAWFDLQCADSGGPSSLAVNQKTGRIYAFWGTRSSAIGGCAAQPFEVNVVAATKVWAATSPDDSAGSWTQSVVADDSGAGKIVGMQLSPGTLDRDGNVWVTYPESPNGYPNYNGAAIRVKWAPPNMTRWSQPITVASSGGDGNVLAHIIAGDPGNIAVAYFHGQRAPGASPAWYLHVARSVDALSPAPHVVDEAVSSIPAYTGTASELMGACGSGPAAGIENGFACGRSTDVWGIALDKNCHVHVAWPAVVNKAPHASAGTYVSSQVGGQPLCGASAATRSTRATVQAVRRSRGSGGAPLPNTGLGTSLILGVALLGSAARIGRRLQRAR